MNVIVFTILAIMLVALMIKAYNNTKDVVINRVNINHPQEDGTALKILQLSDLHLENISISPTELYERLKDEPIDLIALTGDFLDRKRTIPKLVPYLNMLNQLKPKYGMYAVLGNHDYFMHPRNVEKLVQTLEAAGCKVLINEHEAITVKGRMVNIIGVDDFSTKRSQLEQSYQGIAPGINLVLTHDPNVVLHMKDFHFDYLLSGHFHGGQICYPKAYHLVKMGKLARMNVIKGLHHQNGKPFYISEGLGQTGVNIRVGSRPEITIHSLSLKSAVQTNEAVI